MKDALLAFLITATLFPLSSFSQDQTYVKAMIDSLCAPRYHGRGYVENGDTKAAHFIKRQVEELGVDQPVEFQDFEMGVNTFAGQMELTVNGATLKTGADYIIDPKSGGKKGEYDAIRFKPKWVKNPEKLFSMVADEKFTGKVVVFAVPEESTNYATLIGDVYKNPLKAEAYLILTDQKLTWGVSRSMVSFPIFRVTKSDLTKKIKTVKLAVDQTFVSKHQATNVMATLPGTSDTATKMMVFTAHLDHLGRMGAETYIAGASDNASGSAMLLDLYKYYIENRPEQEVRFIWFGGEEAGLVGSKYFVDNSPIPLEDIQFLMNLDLMGDAGKGITAVNGKVFDEHFAKLSSLNMELGLLDKTKPRGPTANSDHHPFYEKGVPCFFVYTMGDYSHYHDIYDVPENLPLAKYDEVFQLMVEFMNSGI